MHAPHKQRHEKLRCPRSTPYLPACAVCRAASYIVCSLPVSSRCYTTTTAAAAAASCCITSAHCLPACLYCSGATAYVWSADKYTAIACSLALLRPVPVPAAASFTSSVGGAARKLYYCSQLSIWSSAPSSYIYIQCASRICSVHGVAPWTGQGFLCRRAVWWRPSLLTAEHRYVRPFVVDRACVVTGPGLALFTVCALATQRK